MADLGRAVEAAAPHLWSEPGFSILKAVEELTRRAERAEDMYQKALTAYQQMCERAERAEAEVMRLANWGASIELRDERALADRLAEAIDKTLDEDRTCWHQRLMDALAAYEEARRES